MRASRLNLASDVLALLLREAGDLDRDAVADRGVLALVHRAVAARAEHALDHILAADQRSRSAVATGLVRLGVLELDPRASPGPWPPRCSRPGPCASPLPHLPPAAPRVRRAFVAARAAVVVVVLQIDALRAAARLVCRSPARSNCASGGALIVSAPARPAGVVTVGPAADLIAAAATPHAAAVGRIAAERTRPTRTFRRSTSGNTGN